MHDCQRQVYDQRFPCARQPIDECGFTHVRTTNNSNDRQRHKILKTREQYYSLSRSGLDVLWERGFCRDRSIAQRSTTDNLIPLDDPISAQIARMCST
jgi:hypothetical protein